MPFMQRITWDGVALHAGELPGGCTRLRAAAGEFCVFASGTRAESAHVS
jgi:hypothetical protein